MSEVADGEWDLIVVGAGAAGMLAAFRAASLGLRTLLLEKNTKAGVKILISGGTRCNLTHATDVSGILSVFVPEQSRFLRRAIHHFSPDRVVSFFADADVPTKTEPNGKVFPLSDRALDVQRALLRCMSEAGVVLQLGQAVSALRKKGELWEIETADRVWSSRALLVTTGGSSYPGCGTTGDAYAWMNQLGHQIVPPRPALVPLTSSDTWVTELSGLTLEDVLVRIVPASTVAQFPKMPDATQRLAVCRKTQRIERRSSLLFAHFGLTGPAAMDVSRSVTDCRSPHEVRLLCDLLPSALRQS
jgi:predicted Rossmann fold flavoprotein